MAPATISPDENKPRTSVGPPRPALRRPRGGLNRGRAEPAFMSPKRPAIRFGASPDKVHDRIVRVTRYVRYGSMLSKNYSTDAGNLAAECFGRLEVKHKFKLRQSSAGSSRSVLSSKNRVRAMGIEEVLTAPHSPNRSKIPRLASRLSFATQIRANVGHPIVCAPTDF